MRTLYYMPLCAFSRCIRMLLVEKGMEFSAVQENTWEARPAFMALNPAGEMPVLVEPDGSIYSGPYAIAEYLDELTPQRSLMGHTQNLRGEVRRLVDWFHGKFQHEVTRNIVFEKVYKKLMQGGEPDSHAIRMGKKNIYYHLDYITNLVRARHWLAHETMTLADIAAAAHLSALDYLGDVPWDHSAPAREWYGIMKSRPSTRSVLNDRIPSFRPPGHYENPDF